MRVSCKIRCGSAATLAGVITIEDDGPETFGFIFYLNKKETMSENNGHQDTPVDVSSQLSKLDLEGGAEQGQELLDRCRVLVDELEVFQNYLQDEKKETAELRHFKSSVKTEYKLLEKVLLCCIYRKPDLSDS